MSYEDLYEKLPAHIILSEERLIGNGFVVWSPTKGLEGGISTVANAKIYAGLAGAAMSQIAHNRSDVKDWVVRECILIIK